MPVPTDITAGTLTITNSSTTVTGVGTAWLSSDLNPGDLILWIEGGDGFFQPILQSVTSNTELTLAEPWPGPTLTGVRYRIRYQWDSSRVSAQSRQLIEVLDNGNILALSSLTGPGVPVFDGPHSMTIKPEADFGDVVGPSGAVADRIAVFDGATGKLIKDGGVGVSGLQSVLSDSTSIELGVSLSGDRFSYIDLHSSDGLGFSARVIRNGGENGALLISQTGTGNFDLNGGSNLTRNGSTIWHSGNGGAGSGLDADLLDGQQGSYYVGTSGTGWYRQANGLLTQHGSTVIFPGGSGLATITFPTAFSSAGSYNAVAWNGDTNINAQVEQFRNIDWPQSTAMLIKCKTYAGGVFTGTIRVDWIAVGV